MKKLTLLSASLLALSLTLPSLAAAAPAPRPLTPAQSIIVADAQKTADSYAKAFVAKAKARSLTSGKPLKEIFIKLQKENLKTPQPVLVGTKYIFAIKYKWTKTGKPKGEVVTLVDAISGVISH